MSEFDFLDITEDDIKQAKSGGKIVFKDKEEVVFLIEELKKKEFKTKDGNEEKLCVSCQIVGGDHDGKKHTFFIGAKGKRLLINILKCFWTEEDILSGKYDLSDLIAKKVESTAVIRNGYTNFYDFTPVSDVPSDIVAPSKEKIEADVKAGSDLF